MDTVLHIIFAAIGLGFLVFIHELGHYWVARRVGMIVEVFSIGFGKAIYSWTFQGVKWQIGWLPFGGYVKIYGMDFGKAEKENDKLGLGFFEKSPLDRIKVALAGPLANLILAILIFAGIWLLGGREKPFSEFTQQVGWVDPQSELYAKGVRPGDTVSSYNGHSIDNVKQLFYAAMLNSDPLTVKGEKLDEETGKKTPFEYKVAPYQFPGAAEGILTLGITTPARYLIYDRLEKRENPLPAGSPMAQSGIQYGDQIVWVDGERVYSMEQVDRILNNQKVLLTLSRNGDTILVRVPRVKMEELKLDTDYREELSDWQHEARMKNKMTQLYFIPYEVSSQGVVEKPLSFIDPEMQELAFPAHPFLQDLDRPLLPGDRIIALDGVPVSNEAQFLQELQTNRVYIVVLRPQSKLEHVFWKKADEQFAEEVDENALNEIVSQFGSAKPVVQAGNLILLNPVIPKTLLDFDLSAEQKAWLHTEVLEQRQKIEAISDPEKRSAALRTLEKSQKRLVLGIYLQDREVNYNPPPQTLFSNVVEETWRTMGALFSGSLNPKWLSGPVGIVQVMQHGWSIGFKEALYWIAAISINLGMLNLLPIPVLDGGYILIALFELISGKRVKPQVMEKLILPFVLVLVCFLLFVTYYDLLRLF